MNTNENILDTRALCIRILEDYGTIKDFCKTAKMKPAALIDKLEGRKSFVFSEMNRIIPALHLNKAEVNRYFFAEGEHVSKTEIQIAEKYIKMSDEQKSVFLKIMDMVMDDPARMEMMESWTGKYADLPATLAQI